MVHVHFEPTLDEQKKLADKKKQLLKPKLSVRYPWEKDDDVMPDVVDSGIGGQFIVQYDVDRDPLGGEVLVSVVYRPPTVLFISLLHSSVVPQINDGYFVHFFSPSMLQPLKKHVVFVLDVSGSMDGRKIEQLREAMEAILDDLKPGDYFNIIEFSYSVTVSVRRQQDNCQ